MFFLQVFDFLHKLGRFLEPPINTGKAHVGHRVNFAQGLHDPFADGHAGHFAVIFVRYFVHNLLDQIGDDFGADGPLLAGLPETGEQFVLGKLLAPAVAFDHDQPFVLDLLIRGETMLALQALPAAADG